MIRWSEALNTNEILNEEAREKLFFPHILETGGVSYYGYGWSILELDELGLIQNHNGDGGGGTFFAQLIRFIDEDITVIMLSNQNSRISETIIQDDVLPILFQ